MLHSYLYVPGDRPDLMSKALSGAAHAIIVDLEDGVAPSAGAAARAATAAFLEERLARNDGVVGPTDEPAVPGMVLPGSPRTDRLIAVRVHPAQLEKDLRLAVAGGSDVVYLPKAESASIAACSALLDQLEASHPEVDRSVPTQLVALIESAQGLLDAPAMARSERVVGLALGEADLCAELGVDPSLPDEQRHALRLPVVIASAAAGLRGPTGPASTDYTDLVTYRRTCVGLRSLGFAARSAVHPAQIRVINEVFSPAADELERARLLVETFDAAVADGRGVIVGDDGQMIDAAVVRSARNLLSGT